MLLATFAPTRIFGIPAGVAELADALDSKSSDRKIVWVRSPPPAFSAAPTLLPHIRVCRFFPSFLNLKRFALRERIEFA